MRFLTCASARAAQRQQLTGTAHRSAEPGQVRLPSPISPVTSPEGPVLPGWPTSSKATSTIRARTKRRRLHPATSTIPGLLTPDRPGTFRCSPQAGGEGRCTYHPGREATSIGCPERGGCAGTARAAASGCRVTEAGRSRRGPTRAQRGLTLCGPRSARSGGLGHPHGRPCLLRCSAASPVRRWLAISGQRLGQRSCPALRTPDKGQTAARAPK